MVSAAEIPSDIFLDSARQRKLIKYVWDNIPAKISMMRLDYVSTKVVLSRTIYFAVLTTKIAIPTQATVEKLLAGLKSRDESALFAAKCAKMLINIKK